MKKCFSPQKAIKARIQLQRAHGDPGNLDPILLRRWIILAKTINNLKPPDQCSDLLKLLVHWNSNQDRVTKSIWKATTVSAPFKKLTSSLSPSTIQNPTPRLTSRLFLQTRGTLSSLQWRKIIRGSLHNSPMEWGSGKLHFCHAILMFLISKLVNTKPD